ncbi:hypothetical protein LTS18_012426, partial [Coniosporium uncinatum]
MRQRPHRPSTVRKYHSPTRPVTAEPGAEPGVDTTKEADPQYKSLRAECAITVVEFSADRMETRELDNDSLQPHLDTPKEEWVTCRWINVDGLSYDVIQMLGNYKKLHRLAIEDLMYTRGWTKADWYSDHAFMLLTLQKLVRRGPYTGDKLEEDRYKLPLWRRILFGQKYHEDPIDQYEAEMADFDETARNMSPVVRAIKPSSKPIRTLQRYRGGANIERAEYMERNSGLTEKGLTVSVEQVSIFLTSDNT